VPSCPNRELRRINTWSSFGLDCTGDLTDGAPARKWSKSFWNVGASDEAFVDHFLKSFDVSMAVLEMKKEGDVGQCSGGTPDTQGGLFNG